jgi:hypothetical protein
MDPSGQLRCALPLCWPDKNQRIPISSIGLAASSGAESVMGGYVGLPFQATTRIPKEASARLALISLILHSVLAFPARDATICD